MRWSHVAGWRRAPTVTAYSSVSAGIRDQLLSRHPLPRRVQFGNTVNTLRVGAKQGEGEYSRECRAWENLHDADAASGVMQKLLV